MSPSESAEGSLPIIFSLSGSVLTDAERSFFSAANPLGFILFDKEGARNIESPDQVRALTNDLRETLGRECPILIDQEGGRVQRLKPPKWRQYPAMKTFGDEAENIAQNDSFQKKDDTASPQSIETLRFIILQMAEDLRDAGINVNCTPVLDVLNAATHEVIGDRAFSEDPEIVARLGLSVCNNLLASGITPVIKHIPGHGRATADSHKELPVVEAEKDVLEKTDFEPFRQIAVSDCGGAVWAMTAHVIYMDIDPDHPASTSKTVIKDVIRGSIGFDGLLVSDDLDMQALSAYGDVSERALKTLEAGCDIVLHCSGNLPDMEKIAESVPKMSPEALRRLQKAAEFRKLTSCSQDVIPAKAGIS